MTKDDGLINALRRLGNTSELANVTVAEPTATFVYDGDGNGVRDMNAVHCVAWSSSSSATARRARIPEMSESKTETTRVLRKVQMR